VALGQGGGPNVRASAYLGPLSYHAAQDKPNMPAPVLQGTLRCALIVSLTSRSANQGSGLAHMTARATRTEQLPTCMSRRP